MNRSIRLKMAFLTAGMMFMPIMSSANISALIMPDAADTATDVPAGYYPSLYLEDGILGVCSANGYYETDLSSGINWTLKAFEGRRISSAVKSGDSMIAVEWQSDKSCRLVKSDASGDVSDITPELISQYGDVVIPGIYGNPLDNGEIYVICKGFAAIKSTDFGASWQKTNIGCDDRSQLAMSPLKKGVMIYSSSYDYGWRAIDFSGNGGNQWTSSESFYVAGSEIPVNISKNQFITGFTFDERTPELVWFGGTGFVGCLKITDLENDKFESSLTFPSENKESSYPGVIIDADDSRILYTPAIVTENGKREISVYKSEDGGTAWNLSDKTATEDHELSDAAAYQGKIYMLAHTGNLYVYEPGESGLSDQFITGPTVRFVNGCLAYETDGISRITVYDAQGHTVLSQQISGNGLIPLPEGAGMYIYRLTNSAGFSQSGKVIR